MAKKNKEKVVLEDIELKPQVIGYTYKKKSNLGRVIFIFGIFLIVILYINEISVFINDLLGKKTPVSIQNSTGNNNENKDNDEVIENKEIIYNIYNSDLTITENNMILNNFNFINNVLTFDIKNNSNNQIDLSNKKYFLETYTEDKTLLERLKVDINTINEGNKISYKFNIKNNFYYLVLVEKTIEDYPVVKLNNNEFGIGYITCTKDIETIVYTFLNNELKTLKHSISDSNIADPEYNTRFLAYQNKINNYKTSSGIIATFNGTLNGYTAVIDIELEKVNLLFTQEKYYFNYKEIPKVVKFEMQTYGFNCN